MIWATISSRSCFCWLNRASPSSAAKNIISLISVLTIWWCPCVELSLWYHSPSLCPTTNAEDTEVEQFYEDLQDILELTPKKDVLFFIVTQSCSTLCDTMDCSPPGSSDHGYSSGKNTGMGCHALLQGIFPTQGSNLVLPHCRRSLYHLRHQGSPHHRGQECKRRKSRDTWSNRQVWPWSTKWFSYTGRFGLGVQNDSVIHIYKDIYAYIYIYTHTHAHL